MQVDVRREPRNRSKRTFSISWKDEDGQSHGGEVPATNESQSGIGIRSSVEIREGTIVYIKAEGECPLGYAVVRHATRRGGSYMIGLELDEATKNANFQASTETSDYYEFLQINPKAQAETIQRVYRFLAARYHPDNPETGDPEKFLHLNQAYETLSDPERRARYDQALKSKAEKPSGVFESVDFLDGISGEINRRLAVLSVLYRKCRCNVSSPQVSLLDLEAQMGFPREYLDFTLWYLRSKKLVKQEDNAELTLTCLGVDFVEENCDKLPLLGKLLAAGLASRPEFRQRAEESRPREAAPIHRLLPGEPLANAPDLS